MAIHWGNLKPVARDKSAVEKWLDWAKAHQEYIVVAGILLLLLAIGIPYYLHSQAQSEKDAQNALNLGQYYLRMPVDPKNGPFKTDVDKYNQAQTTFQRITTDFASTKTAKLARYFEAECQYHSGQLNQAAANFDVAAQELKDVPLGDEANLGKILCLEGENQYSQAAASAEVFLKLHPDSFIAPEIRLVLSDIYLQKLNDKAKAIEQLKIVAQTPSNDSSDWGLEASRRLKELQG